ncbi:MAG TPA: hypothetical protein VLU47_16805, partial [Blastocatellia bacterium]|nr:hypothetical protein [Blastocatellia bacterium]
ENGVRIHYPLPYFMRVLDIALDPSASQASDYDHKTIRHTTIDQPDVSVLSSFRRSVVPILASGVIPIWALTTIVIGVITRMFVRDVFYFHDMERYISALSERLLLLERSPTWLRPQI